MDTQSIIGKKISYYDGFSGSTTAYTVTNVEFDGQGYQVMGDGWAFVPVLRNKSNEAAHRDREI